MPKYLKGEKGKCCEMRELQEECSKKKIFFLFLNNNNFFFLFFFFGIHSLKNAQRCIQVRQGPKYNDPSFEAFI